MFNERYVFDCIFKLCYHSLVNFLSMALSEVVLSRGVLLISFMNMKICEEREIVLDLVLSGRIGLAGLGLKSQNL